MIAFGSAMTDPEAFRRYARPGIARAAEPDSEIYAVAAVGAISRGYNLLLDRAARQEGLEALVLVHQEVEIADPAFCSKIRRAFEDPDVAVVGVAGATGVRSIAWWEGEISCGTVMQRYQEYGGGEQPAFCFKERGPAPAEVEAVDGFLMALSPWAVHNLRFDESLCARLRLRPRLLPAGARGRQARRHREPSRGAPSRELELIDDLDLWMVAHAQAAEKLEDRLAGAAPAGTWKERARRAEADRDGARTVAYSTAYGADAELAPLERELEEMEQSLSWRITAPLRRLNSWRRAAGGRGTG